MAYDRNGSNRDGRDPVDSVEKFPSGNSISLPPKFLLAVVRSGCRGQSLANIPRAGRHRACAATTRKHLSGQSPACNDLAINPMYQALRAEPRFQRRAKKNTTATLE